MTQNEGVPAEPGKAAGANGPATAAALEPLFAQALALHQAGQLAHAGNLYRTVLATDPNHIGSLHHLGIIALSTGRHQDAAAFFAQAIALNERSPQCHYHIGLAFALLGSIDRAAVHTKRAIELDPNHADAHLNLGNILKGQGNMSEAAACYQRALALRAQAPEAHYNLANVLSDQGQFDAAIPHYQAALTLAPNNPDIHNNLGTALAAKGDLSEAAARYRHALALKPALIETYVNLASVLLAMGDTDAALDILVRSLSIRETKSTKILVVQCIRAMQSFPRTKEFRDLVMRALAEAWGRPGDLAQCAIALLKQNEVLQTGIDRATAAWPKRLPAQELFGAEGLTAVGNDLLLQRLLESTPVTVIALERFLTVTRFAVLEVASKKSTANEPASYALGFYCALARQCFINEYVFDAPDAEWEQARRLRDLLGEALQSPRPVPVLWLVVVASYFPLHSVRGADALLERDWPDSVTHLLVQQVREPAQERQTRGSIPALTQIDNDVSRLVRQQYEENPYPRWVACPLAAEPISFDQHMRRQFPLAAYRDLGKSNVDILIAGCGTGRHSIAIAQMFNEARVLAIDLSLSSLAYAKRKTVALGLRNIEYGQADILRLGSIGRTFDVVDSTGVLHHLADPWAGWRVLLSLLVPGGCMRVGLYSESGRRDVTATMAFIAERGYRPLANDIRRCRQELMDFPDGTPQKNVTTSQDFFATSDCRDLIVHVQQQGLTIPMLKAFLNENELQFLGFELDARVLRKYAMRFPEDLTRTNLDLWHVFEAENPYIFADMYVFVVQKQR
jgi:tetratricopeptide (TPR) repeat protein/2-polyprenyl-3-methyl-5-hydroxy-6-metoxy-1,4-benzoquinol methylase